MKVNDEIVNRFSELPWHDSVLSDVTVQNEGHTYSVEIAVTCDTSDGEVNRVHIKFLVVRKILMNVDLLALRFCSGMVWDATCHAEIPREWEESLSYLPKLTTDKYPVKNLALFEVHLVPPSGSILIIAQDFEVIVS